MVESSRLRDASSVADAVPRLPRRARVVMLSVEALAVGVLLGTLSSPTGGDLVLAAFLALLGVAHTELALRVQRLRMRPVGAPYIDLSSIWIFAAAVLLPPVLAAVVIVLTGVHLWLRVWRGAGSAPSQRVYATATAILAAAVAHVVVDAAGGVPSQADDVVGVVGIALAVLVFVAVRSPLLAVGPRPPDVDPGAGGSGRRWDDGVLQVATVCMGALVAVALAAAPALAALALPPIVMLHRAVLVRHLEEVADTDAKTGLLNLPAWRARATQIMEHKRRTGGSAGVLILDLDHFKTVNDAHGHLVGDEVLAAVAAELRAGSRAHDLVGRFGGEEFVVLLRDLPPGRSGTDVLHGVAERLRKRVSRLEVSVRTPGGPPRLSVSIGGALLPVDGGALDQVLAVADDSLYAAKRGGRDRVRIAAGRTAPESHRAAS